MVPEEQETSAVSKAIQQQWLASSAVGCRSQPVRRDFTCPAWTGVCGLTVMVFGTERVSAGLGAKAAGDGASAGDPAMPATAVTAARAALMFPALMLAAAASAA